jgi:HEAT repeat protein
VFALSARPSKSFSRERAERFWLEALHHAEFAGTLDAALFEKAAKAPDAPKSFKTWYERVGPADRVPVVLGGLGAVRRISDPLLLNDLLFHLRPPGQGGKPLVDAVRATLDGLPDVELKIRCLTLLAVDDAPESRQFLEDQVTAAREPELRQAAASALVPWDAPDAAARLWTLYGRLGSGSARAALLEKAYRSDAEPVQSFLLSVVSHDADPDTRRSVLGAVALTEPGKHAPVKRAILLKGLSDADAAVRRASLDALRHLKFGELIEEARRLERTDPSEEVRRAAARTVETLQTR